MITRTRAFGWLAGCLLSCFFRCPALPYPSPPGLIKLFNRNEDMLATVIGHECAHALARHTSEKLTLGLFVALSVQVRLQAA